MNKSKLEKIFIYYQWECLRNGVTVSELVHLGKDEFAKATFTLNKGDRFFKIIPIEEIESQQEMERYFNSGELKLIERKLTHVAAYLDYIYSQENRVNYFGGENQNFRNN